MVGRCFVSIFMATWRVRVRPPGLEIYGNSKDQAKKCRILHEREQVGNSSTYLLQKHVVVVDRRGGLLGLL